MDGAWARVNSSVSLGAALVFRRCAEEQIHVCGDARLVNGVQRMGYGIDMDAFAKGIQHILIPGFHTQFEHDTSGCFQPSDKVRIGEVPGDPGESIPGNAGRVVDQMSQQPG